MPKVQSIFRLFLGAALFATLTLRAEPPTPPLPTSIRVTPAQKSKVLLTPRQMTQSAGKAMNSGTNAILAGPGTNWAVAFETPTYATNHYTNCVLMSATNLAGPWTWEASFPNNGQTVQLMLNAGLAPTNGQKFFRAANQYTP